MEFEDFCAALARGDWEARHFVSGMTILQYPRVIMICGANNNVTLIRQTGTDVDAYLAEALEELSNVA
jgi:hypothetical protein